MEMAICGKNLRPTSENKHVFVSGLARAGTTILMRLLYQTGEFCSLTYRDMPFVLAPNLWAKISGFSHRSMIAQERAHGDKLLVDFDSPEALEEVFWRVFCRNDYISRQQLTPMRADKETIEKFRNFVALIMNRYSSDRYLSKNNNNILRLGSIHEAFPSAEILVPFRTPVQQAYSLLKLHNRFCALHKTNRFAKKYMTWLVHQEFGSDHRPFAFSDNNRPALDTFNIEYWLTQWVAVYDYLRKQAKAGEFDCTFVCFDSLCEQPDSVWAGLKRKVALSEGVNLDFVLKKPQQNDAIISNAALLKKANTIYEELLNLSNAELVH